MPTVVEMPNGVELEFPEGVEQSAIQAAAARDWAENGGDGGSDDLSRGAGGSGADDPVSSASVVGGRLPSRGFSTALPPEDVRSVVDEAPGVMDFIGALPIIAQALDVKDLVTQGFGPGGVLPESITERRELGNRMTDIGALVAAGPAAGAGVKVAGRVAREFAPDAAGGLLGGTVGGSFLPGLGTVAGARLGARAAANTMGRGRGALSRTRRAIKGTPRGSSPTTAENAGSAGDHAASVRDLILNRIGF